MQIKYNESKKAVTKEINVNVFHPVTHIWEYLNLVIIDNMQYYDRQMRLDY